MDPIKDAFIKVKQDIYELKEQLLAISQELESIKGTIIDSSTPADKHSTSSEHILQHTEQENSTYLNKDSAHELPFKALKTPNYTFSTGNRGVPADSQTVSQTVQHTRNKGISALNELPEVLKSLESIKAEVRVKFKSLTKQELAVFTTAYYLEEQGFIVDHSLLSQKLSLTESSIRDYIQRLLKKGAPLIKTKENNKKVLISVSPEFKKILPLSSFQKFKET